jgi:hypothetical protein
MKKTLDFLTLWGIILRRKTVTVRDRINVIKGRNWKGQGHVNANYPQMPDIIVACNTFELWAYLRPGTAFTKSIAFSET